MHGEALVFHLVCALFLALLFGVFLERIKQPAVLGSIASGLCMRLLFGDALPSRDIFSLAGEIGLVFLLFFIGTETNLKELKHQAKISVLGTILQISISLACCFLLGGLLGWELPQVIFFGFCISLSSTAVVLKILEEFGGTKSIIGQQALGVLLVQDLMIVPMLILLNIFGGGEGSVFKPIMGILILGLPVYYTLKKGKLPIPHWIMSPGNRELQVFSALIFCLGASLVTGFFGLSPALGAFIAGMVLARSGTGDAFKRYLDPFRILFVAIFFLSVGLIFDISFVVNNLFSVVLVTLAIMVVNTFVTFFILKILGVDKITALVSGCLLAQIGEFSFLLSARALQISVIDKAAYQLVISCIVISLVLTPLWLSFARKLLRRSFGSSGTIAFQSLKSEPKI